MRPRFLLATTAAAIGLTMAGPPARAQTVSGFGGSYPGSLQPSVGTSSRVNDLRPQIESYFARNAPAPSITAPAWLIEPSIGVDVGFTDNARRVETPRDADVFTQITPGVNVSRDAPRLRLNATYNPTMTVYASQSDQTRFSQQGEGRALGIIVPDAVFLDVRGSITQSSLFGNDFYTQGSTTTYNEQDQVTTYTFSVSPYAQRRFGGWGVGTVGYSFIRTLQDAADDQAFDGFNNASVGPFGTNDYGTTGNLTSQTERASFTSGENLGRFYEQAVVSATQYSGSGSYRGAYRNEANNEVGYALTRTVTVLGGVGYQDLKYAGLPGYRLQEPTWNVGARYTPSGDSTITVLYGRRDGAASVSFDGQFSPTSQTRVLGRYNTGITSDLQEAQTILDATSVGSSGTLVDIQTGAPITTSGLGGTQNGIYRVNRLSLTGFLLRRRDTFSIGLTSEDRTTLTTSNSFFNNAVIPAGTSTSSIYTTATWQHELTPEMQTLVSAQYGTTNNTTRLLGTAGDRQRTISLSAILSRQFTPTLTGSIRYTFTDQSGGTQGNNTFFNPVFNRTFNTGAYTENLLLVGLRKSF